jgi:hypothetical protein
MTEIAQHLSGPDLARAPWRKSTYSGNGGGGSGCVEVAPLEDGSVAVRHTQHRDGPVIVYTKAEWEAFVAGVRDGQFDF